MNKVRVSHILVNKLGTAKELIERINAGESFSKLAKDFSMCPSRKKGGDLGFFEKGKMVKEFEKSSFALEIGELSEPVKTMFGYHIIRRTA